MRPCRACYIHTDIHPEIMYNKQTVTYASLERHDAIGMGAVEQERENDTLVDGEEKPTKEGGENDNIIEEDAMEKEKEITEALVDGNEKPTKE